ncbi:MAG: ribonuclease P protein component [bacterium]
MLPREQRLSSSREIKNILRNGKKIDLGYLNLYVMPGNGKIGFITTRGFKNAVMRNRTKRRIRGAFESGLFKINNYDMLFVIKPESSLVESSKMREDFSKILLEFVDG